MFRKMKPVLLIIVIALLSLGCNQIAPELSFNNLSISPETLTIQSSAAVINASIKDSPITLSGICETNLNIVLKGLETYKFKCSDQKYSLEISATAFNEGNNTFSIESYDDAQNKMASDEIQIVKDTIVPEVSILGPNNIGATVSSISLNGSCSENQQDVVVTESVHSEKTSVKCQNGNWSYDHSIAGRNGATEFKFKATHHDTAMNEAQSLELVVSRTVLAGFSVLGIKNPSTAGSNYEAILRNPNAYAIIEWTPSVGAASYDLKIKRVSGSGESVLCSFNNLNLTSHTFNIPTACSGITPGDNLVAEVKAWDAARTTSTLREFNFRVKLPSGVQGDANLLYANTDLAATVTNSFIPYSQIVLDPDSSGPFTITIDDPGTLSGQITAQNSTIDQSLKIGALEGTSGVSTIKFRITDESGFQSPQYTIKIAVVSPFSWTGNIDNDFNNKGNWCGVASLKSGCEGSTASPSINSRIMIDNLCHSTRTPSNCNPVLSNNTSIRSFYMKSESFHQNTHSLTAGSSSGGASYLIMSGGRFNDPATSGDLTVYTKFHILGGTFTAPLSSNIFLNSIVAPTGGEAFKIQTEAEYIHNQSTLHLIDSAGSNLNQNIVVPANTRLFNLNISSSGGYWTVVSDNLILDGDLNLGGTKYAGIYSPLLNGIHSAKISLKGNLNCEGDFGGGTLSVFMTQTATYKSTTANCKFPFVKLNTNGITISEAGTSTQDAIFQGLEILNGNFTAPGSPRNLVFKPLGLPTETVVADLLSGFNHNNGEIIFETEDSSKNYKIKLGTVNGVAFRNPSDKNAFFDIQNNFTAAYFGILGSNPVPLRGLNKTVSTQQIVLNSGISMDPNRLSKINLLAGGPSSSIIDAAQPINIPNIELQKHISFSGSTSGIYDFSGTTFILNAFDLYISGGATLKYFNHTGTGGTITGGGAILSGN